MRSLWKGTISFGLVTIPVKLYAATEDHDVKFRFLHGPCHTPVRYVKSCPTCDREVAMDEIVRGYEYEPGRFVVMAEEDLENLPTPVGRTVEILQFVEMAEIDPIYYDRTYFLEPGEGGARAYGLLRRAMAETGRVGVAKVAIRTKSSLAAVRVFQGRMLVMETMYFPDEVRDWSGLTVPEEATVREQELQMARSLIGMLDADFAPERFTDDYRQAVLTAIEAKVTGAQIVEPPTPARGQVVDLMAALQESLRQAAQGQPTPPPH